MIRQVFILLFLANFHVAVHGQDPTKTSYLQPYRYEKERKFSDDDFMIIPLHEEGLALIRDKQKFKAGNKTWELILLDSMLQEKHALDLDVEQRKNLIGYEQAPGSLFLLFKVGEHQKVPLDLIGINLYTAAISRFEIKPELALQITHFSKIENNFILGGYVNNEPTVLLYNPATDNLKVLPGFFQKQTEIIDLRPNQNQTFNAVLVDRSDRDQRKLIFKTFDINGIELLEDISEIEEKYILQTGLSSILIRDDLMVIGTWGMRNSKQSLGFYAIPIDPYTEHKVRYTAFGELEHYLDYQKPKRAKRIKEKTKEALNQQRTPDFSNYVMPYRVEEHPDGYVLHAEVFTPSSSYNRYPTDNPFWYNPYWSYSPFWGYYPGMYNRMYNPFTFPGSNVRNSDEIKTSQSVLVAFNAQGAVQWDYSMNLGDIRTPSVDQVADFCLHQGKIHFFYKKESELLIKTITLETGEAEEITEKIQLLNDEDELRSESKNSGAIRQWYGRNFYVWGQQTLRNRANRGEGTRQVFYINKLVVN